MKRSLLLLSLFTIGFLSCKKDKKEPVFYLTCTIDGTEKTFNVAPYAFQSTTPGDQAILVGSAETSAANSPTFSFQIANFPSNQPIIAGTYTDAETNFEVLSTYEPDDRTAYEAGSTLRKEVIRTGVAIQNPLRVVISNLDDGFIRGTFSGDFHLDNSPSKAKKVITNGKFYLSLVKVP